MLQITSITARDEVRRRNQHRPSIPLARAFISVSQWPPATSGFSPSIESTRGLRLGDAATAAAARLRRSCSVSLYAAARKLVPVAVPMCVMDSRTSERVRALITL